MPFHVTCTAAMQASSRCTWVSGDSNGPSSCALTREAISVRLSTSLDGGKGGRRTRSLHQPRTRSYKPFPFACSMDSGALCPQSTNCHPSMQPLTLVASAADCKGTEGGSRFGVPFTQRLPAPESQPGTQRVCSPPTPRMHHSALLTYLW